MDFGGQRLGVDHLMEYVETATSVGFDAVAVNDHLVFGVPWLDGPTALAAVAGSSGRARLFTTVSNPVVRGPAPLAKALAALDVLSGGRVVAGLGPGSSARDYDSVGVPFDERWPRFDEAVSAMRALLQGRTFHGRYYNVDEPLEPVSRQPSGPSLWVGSWGSDAGLRRAVRLGDGWLTSAYNISAQQFVGRWERVQEMLSTQGRRDPADFGNGVATMWFHIGESRARDILDKRLAPLLNRPADELRERLAFGSADLVTERLSAFRDAGVQWMFLWPVTDDLEQLQLFGQQVKPHLGDRST